MPLKVGSCVAGYVDRRQRCVYLAADSLAVDSAGTRAELATPKLFAWQNNAVGIVGSLRVAQVFRRVLEEHEPPYAGEELMAWLAETLSAELESAGGVSDQTEWAALVASAGRLFVLQSDFSWYEPVDGFWAEGAGADAAWAVLWLGWLGYLTCKPEELVTWAIRAAMMRNCRVGGEVRCVVVGPED